MNDGTNNEAPMSRTADAHAGQDVFNLKRFTDAQEPVYTTALDEIRAGRKRSHWIWYIFPQVAGLGYSPNSKFYAIGSLEEARLYLDHPVLGARLRECAEAVLAVEGRSAREIMGSPDDVKLQSSMTLFAHVAGASSVFTRVLEKHFDGRQDAETLRRLGLP